MHHRHTTAALRRHTYPDRGRALRHLHRQRAAAHRPSEIEQHLARQATAALDALGDTASTFVRRAARLGVPAAEAGAKWGRALRAASPSLREITELRTTKGSSA